MAAEASEIETPPRAALVFPREALPSGMPFALRRDLAAEAALPASGGRSWLPSPPLSPIATAMGSSRSSA